MIRCLKGAKYLAALFWNSPFVKKRRQFISSHGDMVVDGMIAIFLCEAWFKMFGK